MIDVDTPAGGPQVPEPLRHLQVASPWLAAFGALLFALGAAAIAFEAEATRATVYFNGVMLILAGAAEMAVALRARGWLGFFLWVIGGALNVFAGVFALVNPLLASVILTLFLGAGLIVAGLVRMFHAFRLPADHPRFIVGLGGVTTLLLGLVIVSGWPANSVFTLGLLLGVDLMFNGAGWLAFAWGLRARF
ncbi:MAG: DUF308 domain-containing protein [Hyphomicrobiales bacterium]|nr:DUF308 domain-containing protein [Hyphomicrobiales bacterium]MDE2016280.1 DUF308 domain-containing protein [Hyphomicrobiales bacterium]